MVKSYYFKHDSNARNDEKLLSVRMKHGMRGYGIYWAIIEKLREASDYMLDAEYKSIAWDIRAKEPEVRSIIEDFGLFTFEDGKFYSQRLIDDMNVMDKMRKGGRPKDDKQAPKAGQQTILTHDCTGTPQTPKKTGKGKYTEAERELHSKCRAAFTDIYRQAKGEEFVWSAKEMAGLVGVIADVKVKMKAKGYDTDNNDTVADNLAHFVNLIFQRADDWTKRNATPTLIHSKFNEIYTTIANNTANGNKQTATNNACGRAIDNPDLMSSISAKLQSGTAQ